MTEPKSVREMLREAAAHRRAEAAGMLTVQTKSVAEEEDTEERYRQHLAFLINRTRSRGHSRYFNKYVNRCRDEAAVAYPKGAAIAQKKDAAVGGVLGALAVLFSFLG